MRGLVTLLVLVGISAGVFALGSLKRGTDDKPLLHVADEVALTVVTAKPSREPITRLVQAPGDVEAVLEVDISSETVSKIIEMPVEEGDIVKKGQLLCRLDDERLRAEVVSANARIAQLRASIAQADADLEKSERDVRRQRSLSESNATSHLEMADYLTLLKKTKAVKEMREQELIQSQAYLTRMEEELKKTVITSPIDGVVTNLQAKEGEVVVTGTMNNPGTVIMSISDLSKMQVRTRVDEVDVPLVKAGQKARIYLQSDPNSPIPARVVRVASKGTRPVGRDVVTFETLMEVLSDDDRIRPGMTANVEIEVARREEAITIPVEAIANRLRKDLPKKIVEEVDRKQANVDLSERVKRAQYINVVFVKKDDVVEVRAVDIGIADTRRVEILSGIEMGDEIVTGPYRSIDQLKDGKKVALAESEKKQGKDKPEETDEKQASDGDDADSDDQKKETVVKGN